MSPSQKDDDGQEWAPKGRTRIRVTENLEIWTASYPPYDAQAENELRDTILADHRDAQQLRERVRVLEEALRGVEATDIEKLPMDADQAVALFVVALDKTRDIAHRALLSPQESSGPEGEGK